MHHILYTEFQLKFHVHCLLL